VKYALWAGRRPQDTALPKWNIYTDAAGAPVVGDEIRHACRTNVQETSLYAEIIRLWGSLLASEHRALGPGFYEGDVSTMGPLYTLVSESADRTNWLIVLAVIVRGSGERLDVARNRARNLGRQRLHELLRRP
jgi:hypothetical protein